MNNFERTFKELENYLESFEKKNYKVSKNAVGWHIDHSLRVINNAIFQLKSSNPQQFIYSINLNRIMLFYRKKLKRKSLRTSRLNRTFELITLEELKSQFEFTKKNIKSIEEINQKSHFRHSRFGLLNVNQTYMFLDIHTKHHLEIIKDIISAYNLVFPEN